MAVKLTSKEQQIVEDNINLVHHILKKFPYVQKNYDDYFQAGVYGLCLAAQRFKDGKGAVFATYASTYITGYIKRQYSDFEQGQVRLPRKLMYANKEDIKPKYLYFENIASDYYLKSENFESDSVTNLDVEKFISKLSKREKEILELSLYGNSQIEISKILNISQPLVSRLKNNIKKNIRTTLQIKEDDVK